MAIRRRLGRALLVTASIAGVLLWGVALLLFSQVAENSDDFANYAVVYVVINAFGIAVLVALIARRLVRLVRDYRRFVPGSRLQARMVSVVVLVSVIPLVILYMFATAFIMRGIDDWLDVDVGEGLDAALALVRAAIDLRRADSLSYLNLASERLAAVEPNQLDAELAELASAIDASELVLYESNDRVLASYSVDPSQAEPRPLPPGAIGMLPSSSLEVSAGADYYNEIHAMVAVPRASGQSQILWARFAVPETVSELSSAVDSRHAAFGQLAGLRVELKGGFAATLSLVLTVAVLAAIYAAFFVAQRLILPIQQLMQGTRAVARGDFDTKVPLAQGDEIGFLVNSFNNMTNRLAVARQEAMDSERRLENERSKLEVILARLSTGVVSLESDLTIRTANEAAGVILGVDLEQHIGESLVDLAGARPLLGEFLNAIANHLELGKAEWREQISLRGEHGNRELVCACSELPQEAERDAGYILVFDDITALMQAQKEAAWGEVARRLAHEIKNPLTPIQLSAERVRRRYLTGGERDVDLLDRATHTIIQQVDAMKGMVDAFSEYARAPDLELGALDLNALIAEVTEMYRHQEPPIAIKMELDASLPIIQADVGRMRQVIHNLMRNASEAVEGQADAEIVVATRQRNLAEGAYAEIVVADNGPGFATDIIDQAFLPYVTSKVKGTGLGLAIVRKLVDEHRGRIRVGNKGKRGAEVSILLPLTEVGRINGGRAQHRRKRA